MAKIDYSKIFLKEAVPTSIGGQAVMEGIMMQGEDKTALAMRLPDDSIYLETEAKKPRPGIMKVPLIRGVVAFFMSLISGMSALTKSADILEEYLPEEERESESKFEKWLNSKFGEKATWNVMMALAIIFAVVITVIFFIILPTWAVNFLKKYIDNTIALNLIEGVIRIIIFVLYILAIRKMEDIHKLFQYHGAEHKTIHCFENGLELTPENADGFYSLHPRCGTSFLVFVLIISILLFSLLGWPNLLWRIVSRLLLLPFVAGISYELLRWAGRSDNAIVRVLSYPGLMLQKLTTAEPDKKQLEVAIAALEAVLDESDNLGVQIIGGKGTAQEYLDKLEAQIPFEEELASMDVNDHTVIMNAETGKDVISGKTIDLNPAGIEIIEEPYRKPWPKVCGRRFSDDPGTVGHTLNWGESALGMIDNGRNEADIIFSYVSGMSRADMITRAREMLSEAEIAEYEKLIKERIAGKPLQYITKVQEFMGLPFKVNPSVLIPRLDTEVLAEQVIEIIKGKEWQSEEFLDMCTGSGVLGITLASKFPEARVTMTELDMDAMSTAIGNAQLNNVFKKCNFLIGDMFNAIPDDKKYKVIVSNPPYIRTAEIDKLSIEVKDHEPRMALDGGEDGLSFYRILAREAGKHLEDGGVLALEIGCDQGYDVQELLRRTGEYNNISVIKDLAGLDRVVIAERK